MEKWNITLNDYEPVEIDQVYLGNAITLHTEVADQKAGQAIVDKLTEAQLEEFTISNSSMTITNEFIDGEVIGYQCNQTVVGTEKRWFADVYLKAKSAPDLTEEVLVINESGVGPRA